MKKIQVNIPKFIPTILNLLILALLLLLPYYLFEGRLFLGGDDTRLHYIYPIEFLKNLSLYGWVNISSLPTFLPNYHSIPFLSLLALLEKFVSIKEPVFYFVFSLPFCIGFIFFQKYIRLLVDNDFSTSFLASLIYIFSPITVISQMTNFLFSMYLVGIVPIIAYYYVSYLKYGKRTDLIKVVCLSIIFSIALFAIQWILAILLPLIIGGIVVISLKGLSGNFLKRTFIFSYLIISSQLFWIFPFIMSFIYKGGGDLGSKIVSKNFTNSFVETILSTATGSILYPLFTFYQRNIAFDYEWHISHVFSSYFDFVLPFSFIFVLILFLGLRKYNSVLSSNKRKIFIFFFTSFIFVLYFSTVNIGFLKNLFLLFAYVPGFAIFRNFTDKFALSYIFIYSSLLALCLTIIRKSYKFYLLLVVVIIAVVCVNNLPIKRIVVTPLWRTDSVFTTVNLPSEYELFLRSVKQTIPEGSNIIAFPQNLVSYSVITESDGKHAYVGTSPFKFLTSINDLSGSGSYPEVISGKIHDSIVGRDYSSLLIQLSKINVGYLMVTNNIPSEVLNSYLFDKEYLKFQDKEMLNAITDHELLRSKEGNYVIYKLKNSSNVITSNRKIEYRKISPILYTIKIQNLKGSQDISLLETYHPGWKIFFSGINIPSSVYFADAIFAFKKSYFSNTHKLLNQYGNEWTVDSEIIKKVASKNVYTSNKDGSISFTLYLYFFPQIYFYAGIILTLVLLFFGFFFLDYEKNKTK